MLAVIVFSKPVLVPVTDQALSVVRILVHGCLQDVYDVVQGLISTDKLNN